MPKALSVSGMVVAGLLLLLFGADLAVRFPFERISMPMDIAFLICAIGLGYMSFTAFREQA